MFKDGMSKNPTIKDLKFAARSSQPIVGMTHAAFFIEQLLDRVEALEAQVESLTNEKAKAKRAPAAKKATEETPAAE